MNTIKFYGHSDDCLEIDVNEKPCAELSAYDETVRLKVEMDEGRIDVKCVYDLEVGVWQFTPTLNTESIEWVHWPMRCGVEHGYSMFLEIDVPGDCVISNDANGKWVVRCEGGKAVENV